MADRIHYLMHEIEPPISDDHIQSAKNKSSDEEEYRAEERKSFKEHDQSWTYFLDRLEKYCKDKK
ncbi:MAG: hypothetical protein WAK17_05300 [Candidatus Nitrosopolaris sp.]|jgi:hypothetical protein